LSINDGVRHSVRFPAKTMERKHLMKTIILIAATLAAALCGGCATTAQRYYQTSSAVAPASEPHQYLVQFRISEVQPDGQVNLLNTPKLPVTAGKEARLFSGYAQEKEGVVCENGVVCTALVAEHTDRAEAKTSILLTSNGKETIVSSQSAVLNILNK